MPQQAIGSEGCAGPRAGARPQVGPKPGRAAGGPIVLKGTAMPSPLHLDGLVTPAVGRTIVYRDTDRNVWVDAMVRSGVSTEYGQVLCTLTETIASGRGSQPNGDVLAATGAAPIGFADLAAKTARCGSRRGIVVDVAS
jgi:hypothetical protein